MNELTNEKMMSVKEVAEILNVSERTIQRHIKEMCPEKIINGQQTFLNEKEVTLIKLRIERSGRNDLDNVVELPKTELEKELLIKQAMIFQNEKIELLKEKLQEKENQVKRLIHANKLYTTTEIAKELNLKSAQELNIILKQKNIQYLINGTWVLTAEYSNKNYESIKQMELESGQIIYDRKWTGTGRDFILSLFKAIELNIKA